MGLHTNYVISYVLNFIMLDWVIQGNQIDCVGKNLIYDMKTHSSHWSVLIHILKIREGFCYLTVDEKQKQTDNLIYIQSWCIALEDMFLFT